MPKIPKQKADDPPKDITGALYEIASALREIANNLKWLDSIGQLITIAMVNKNKGVNEFDDAPF